MYEDMNGYTSVDQWRASLLPPRNEKIVMENWRLDEMASVVAGRVDDGPF